MQGDLKSNLIHSILMLFTIVNGIIAGFSLGITELIKYMFKNQTQPKVTYGVGVNLPVQQTITTDPFLWKRVNLTGVPLEENLGWIFLLLMFVGIIGLIILRYYENVIKKRG